MRICSPQQFTNASLRDTVGCKLELAAAAGSGQFITSLDTDDSYAATYLAEMVLGMKVRRPSISGPGKTHSSPAASSARVRSVGRLGEVTLIIPTRAAGEAPRGGVPRRAQ
jgi:hypothetical protein